MTDFRDLAARLDAAVDAGLIAAASVVVNEAKKNTRGAVFAVPDSPRHHVTGNLQNSITRSEPEGSADARSIRIGTNVDYGLFWEVGWHPAFGHRVANPATGRQTLIQHEGPRRLLRNEWLRPALMNHLDDVQAAFARTAVRIFEGAGVGVTFDLPASEAAD